MMAHTDEVDSGREQLRATLKKWQVLAETDQSPEPLQPLLPALAGLVSAALVRLDGELTDQQTLIQFMIPVGELMLAPTPAFLRWLSVG